MAQKKKTKVGEYPKPNRTEIKVLDWLHRCSQCGDEFIAKRRDASTCSDVCRDRKRRKVPTVAW